MIITSDTHDKQGDEDGHFDNSAGEEMILSEELATLQHIYQC